jgi:hypothetical protein
MQSLCVCICLPFEFFRLFTTATFNFCVYFSNLHFCVNFRTLHFCVYCTSAFVILKTLHHELRLLIFFITYHVSILVNLVWFSACCDLMFLLFKSLFRVLTSPSSSSFLLLFFRLCNLCLTVVWLRVFAVWIDTMQLVTHEYRSLSRMTYIFLVQYLVYMYQLNVRTHFAQKPNSPQW